MSQPSLLGPSKPSSGLEPTAPRGVSNPLRLLTWLAVFATFAVVVPTPLELWPQLWFGVALFVACVLLSRIRDSRLVTIMLAFVSALVSVRYLTWRILTTFDSEGGTDLALGLVLLAAETYAVLVLLLGYFQTIWPLRRRPVPLPEDRASWPTVDVMIPTYNEPLAVVRATILAARALDYPREKLKIWVLDDGRRDEFKRFCSEVGVGYLTRPDNADAKAGNINRALERTHGELVAIFDSDHIPTSTFLQTTIGWFIRDPKLALVQTPHHFYSPDPFERNLGTFKKVPNEGELFYGTIQKGNDLWDAAFFCGSCAVIRRAPLEEIGGVAPETVTEDAHTMLRLHRRGYRSAYLDLPQAGGLATESLSSHVGQRIRWARGMAQVFRLDPPIFGRGLSLGQRLCYTSAMLHFFYGIPRIIFLIAPLFHLFFNAHIFNASAAMILAYAIPHIAHAYLTNARIQGRHRHSFWAEVYETTLAGYIAIPTTLAIISPRLGRFNVTGKGGVVDEPYFDFRIAIPHLLLLGLNVAGLAIGISRLAAGDVESDAVGLNIAWTAYNSLFLGAALGVAWERRQRRATTRLTAELPAMLRTPDQRVYACKTVDMSVRGARLRLPVALELKRGDVVELAASLDRDVVPTEAKVVWVRDDQVAFELVSPSVEAESSFVRALFSRGDAWVDWARDRRSDRPLLSFFRVMALGLVGLVKAPATLFARKGPKVSALLIGLALAGAGPATSHAAEPEPEAAAAADDADEDDVPPGWTARSLEGLGFSSGVRRYNRWPSVRLPFFARGDEVFTAARVEFRFDPEVSVPATVKALAVTINDEEVGAIAVGAMSDGVASLEVAPQLLGEKNALGLRFELTDDALCTSMVEVGSWRFLKGGRILTRAAPLPLPNALEILPLPFFDPFADTVTPIAVVFAGEPTARHVEIAAVIAGYFAARAGSRFTFPTYYGELPEGHAVVLATAEDPALVPDLGPLDRARIAIRDNPFAREEHAKLLVLAGRDLDDVARAAKKLAFDYEATTGLSEDDLFVDGAPEVPPRRPYDAPRWRPTGASVRLGDVSDDEGRTLHGALGGTLTFEFRVPPDLFVWPSRSIDFELAWRQMIPPGITPPSVAVELNGHYLEELGAADGASERSASLRFPVSALKGYNRVLIHVVPGKEGYCPNPESDAFDIVVDPESRLELEDNPNFKLMPDVSTFIDDGYPFTRLADLSQTLLLLPSEPLPQEIASALSFASHAAAVTGHPASGMQVAFGGQPSAAVGRDILAIGVAERLALLTAWEDELPLANLGRGAPILREVGLFERAVWWLRGEPLAAEEERLFADLRPGPPKSYVLGLESPLDPGMSAVIVTADDAEALPSLHELRGFAWAVRTRSDLLLRHGPRRSSYHVSPTYSIGELPFWTALRFTVSRFWFVIVPSILLVALFFALIMRRRLARLEWERLSIGDPEP